MTGAVFPKAAVGAVAAKANFVRTPTFQPKKMLRDARVAALAGRTAVSRVVAGRRLRAVHVDRNRDVDQTPPQRRMTGVGPKFVVRVSISIHYRDNSAPPVLDE